MNRRQCLKAFAAGAASWAIASCSDNRYGLVGRRLTDRPNILLCISDDQSWLHAGAYGDKFVKTPNFDRVAQRGVLFTHAFAASPCCTPSRSAILTGQEIWRLEEGGLLAGTLPAKFKVFPDLLEQAGYHVGYTHKGWSPGDYRAGGRDHDPVASRRYNSRKLTPPSRNISTTDYAANFEDFLNDCPPHQPFYFWFGAEEPHRRYERGFALRSGKKLTDVTVPPFLPDAPEVRGDILDYYAEIEWFDEHLGRMLQLLEKTGRLDNTIVVVTSDNGMPYPRAKGNLYDFGVRMPLAVQWPAKVAPGRTVDDFVSLADLAPTFLEAAGLPIPPEMTGRSIMNILLSRRRGRIDPDRDCVFTASERITWCRPNGAGYPCRAIRTHRWLYIRNYEPDRWPAGDPTIDADPEGIYGDVNAGPTKTYMIRHSTDPSVAPLFRLGFAKRPAEELYDVTADPCQLHNLADDPALARVKRRLRRRLEQYQRRTKDPRAEGKNPWDWYPYYWRGRVKWPVKPHV